MKSAFVFVTVLALAGSAFAAGCINTPDYKSSLNLGCTGNEVSFNWPNYKNVGQYYACQGVGRPILLSCGPNTYFSYVLQGCQDCASYIPSQPCETLKIQKGSSCQPLNGGSTEPTPIYPTDTTKATTVTKTTTTKAPVVTTTKRPGVTDFPPAPSPVTVDPSIPIPPTAAPTPPSVEAKPPSIVVPT